MKSLYKLGDDIVVRMTFNHRKVFCLQVKRRKTGCIVELSSYMKI